MRKGDKVRIEAATAATGHHVRNEVGEVLDYFRGLLTIRLPFSPSRPSTLVFDTLNNEMMVFKKEDTP